MLVSYMNEEHGVSFVRAVQPPGWPTYQYQAKPKDDEEVIDALNALVAKHPAIGFWQAFHRLRLAGHAWNHKRVYRLHGPRPQHPFRRPRSGCRPVKQRLFQPEGPNEVWSLDYLHDSLWDGRAYRLNVIDDYTGRCSASKPTRRCFG